MAFTSAVLSRGQASMPSEMPVIVNRSLVWVHYPSCVSREDIVVFIQRYYAIHPAKFRPFESVEVSLADVRALVHLPVALTVYDDFRQRAASRAPRGSLDKTAELADSQDHGTARLYRRGCRCDACKTGYADYQRTNRELKCQSVS